MNATIRQWRYGKAYGDDLFRNTAAEKPVAALSGGGYPVNSRIIIRVVPENETLRTELESLTTEVGARPVGSPAMERARDTGGVTMGQRLAHLSRQRRDAGTARSSGRRC